MPWQTPKTDWTPVDGVTNADMNRIEENTRILSQQGGPFGVTAGTGTAYTINASPPVTELLPGTLVSFQLHLANTGAVTINVNGQGAKGLLKPNGNALSAGNLKKDSICSARYNGTAFILQGEGGEYGNVRTQDVRSGRTYGTDEGLATGTLDLTNLKANNIRAGIPIDGITGTLKEGDYKIGDKLRATHVTTLNKGAIVHFNTTSTYVNNCKPVAGSTHLFMLEPLGITQLRVTKFNQSVGVVAQVDVTLSGLTTPGLTNLKAFLDEDTDIMYIRIGNRLMRFNIVSMTVVQTVTLTSQAGGMYFDAVNKRCAVWFGTAVSTKETNTVIIYDAKPNLTVHWQGNLTEAILRNGNASVKFGNINTLVLDPERPVLFISDFRDSGGYSNEAHVLAHNYETGTTVWYFQEATSYYGGAHLIGWAPEETTNKLIYVRDYSNHQAETRYAIIYAVRPTTGVMTQLYNSINASHANYGKDMITSAKVAQKDHTLIAWHTTYPLMGTRGLTYYLGVIANPQYADIMPGGEFAWFIGNHWNGSTTVLTLSKIRVEDFYQIY